MTLDVLQVGDKLRFRDRLYHVRGFVDDRVVLREWWRSKRRWNYTIEGVWFFEHRLEAGGTLERER